VQAHPPLQGGARDRGGEGGRGEGGGGRGIWGPGSNKQTAHRLSGAHAKQQATFLCLHMCVYVCLKRAGKRGSEEGPGVAW
jgi:hypothetical protein